jgi:hypothetical protein
MPAKAGIHDFPSTNQTPLPNCPTLPYSPKQIAGRVALFKKEALYTNPPKH